MRTVAAAALIVVAAYFLPKEGWLAMVIFPTWLFACWLDSGYLMSKAEE